MNLFPGKVPPAGQPANQLKSGVHGNHSRGNIQ